MPINNCTTVHPTKLIPFNGRTQFKAIEKVPKLYVMKVCRGRVCRASRVLNLDIKKRSETYCTSKYKWFETWLAGFWVMTPCTAASQPRKPYPKANINSSIDHYFTCHSPVLIEQIFKVGLFENREQKYLHWIIPEMLFINHFILISFSIWNSVNHDT
jgi:hypothetical protein